jgi:hypothetical protein
VDQLEDRNTQFDAASRALEAKQAAEMTAERAENNAIIRPMRAEIERAENGNTLDWAWRRLTGLESSRSRLGTGKLVEAVGEELAEVFVTGFKRWWRRHEPPLPEPGSPFIPTHNLIGLTGLSFEIEHGLDLQHLTDAEAERAARYALYELNGFPMWFDALVAAHPLQARSVLARAVHNEWVAKVENYGVIARARYEPSRTAELVRDLVILEIERDAPGHVRTVRHAVTALLLATLPGRDAASALHRHVEATAAEDNIQVLIEWLRGWSHLAPENAARWLRRLAASDRPRFVPVVAALAALLEEDFDEPQTGLTLAWSPAALESWVQMLHIAVRPEDDIKHAGAGMYRVEARDQAQSFRERCVTKLSRDPSRSAFDALRRIQASKDMAPYADLVSNLVENQLTIAAEELATPWTEADILAVERGDERPPRTNGDLFALLQRHLARVAALLENDDFSYAVLFGETLSEKVIQCWVASSLKLLSHGLYTVEREPAAQDDKLMDISITVPGVGRIPVEIKPLYMDRYSYPELQKFVSEQLLGRYMRPASIDRGIFLLVPLVTRTWKVRGRQLTFDQLFRKLTTHAKTVGTRAYKEIAVMSVDIAKARQKKLEKTDAPRAHQAKLAKTSALQPQDAPRKRKADSSVRRRR